MLRNAAIIVGALTLTSCIKVPLVPVNAGFVVADAAWFGDEQTLFVFWDVAAEQGLGDASVIEITYTTDDERVDWTAIDALPTVHTHVPVDCGAQALCGSTSLDVPLEPRDVRIRLRYHRDGSLALDPDTLFNVVQEGGPPNTRSLLVYGVFGEANERVQWRGRHNFPTLRNMEAQRLGLLRYFSVQDVTAGDADLAGGGNVYGYGARCPEDFEPIVVDPVETLQRAIFYPEVLPLAASSTGVLCAQSTVTDATGTFTTSAIARKNPEVRAAFPQLNSPVDDATPIRFMLGPCRSPVVSEDHEQMQRQRLLIEDVPTTCIDDWQSPTFVERLAATFNEAVEAERSNGNDMVLVVGLNRELAGVAVAVEEALLQVVPPERTRSTPRLAGAFVFDSDTRGLDEPQLAASTLWCPSRESGTDTSSVTCATQPDLPEIALGPLEFGILQIFPNRTQYLDFIEDFGTNQTGSMEALTYRVPEFSASGRNLELGEFGVVTFLNQEILTADVDDAFSFCAQEEPTPVVFSSDLLTDPEVIEAVAIGCEEGELPDSICQTAGVGVLLAEALPVWHEIAAETEYDIGLFWDFPFLVRLEYRTVVAGSATVLGFSLPFGFGAPTETYFGSDSWLQESFSLDPTLTQCRRFCDHPTFTSAGVYSPTIPFRGTYASDCYLPVFPVPGQINGGFPLDP